MEHLFVVDDHPVFGEALTAYLSNHLNNTIHYFSDPQAAFEAISSCEEALVVVDIQMPGMSGLQLQQKLWELSGKRYRFVFCTAERPERIFLEPGVLGRVSFFFKDEPLNQLLECIQQALDGKIHHSKACEGISIASVPKLTPRQMSILSLLKRGCSNEEISTQLNISLNTTKTHLRELFVRLDVKNRTSCLLSAERMGLIPVGEQ